jgi:hypothetical protein
MGGPSYFSLNSSKKNRRIASHQTPYFLSRRRQKVSKKRLSPCGGHLLCLMSESAIDDSALEAGPLQGGLPYGVTYKGKA